MNSVTMSVAIQQSVVRHSSKNTILQSTQRISGRNYGSDTYTQLSAPRTCPRKIFSVCQTRLPRSAWRGQVSATLQTPAAILSTPSGTSTTTCEGACTSMRDERN
nr:uncharacterized protein LOC128690973 isoform X3 [Cherax quadricarinatus]